MNNRYAAVWLDHQIARVLFLHQEDSRVDERSIKAAKPHPHPHRAADGRAHEERRAGVFFEESPGSDRRPSTACDQAAAACAGNVSLNVLPLPTSLVTSMRPPCASAIRRAM